MFHLSSHIIWGYMRSGSELLMVGRRKNEVVIVVGEGSTLS